MTRYVLLLLTGILLRADGRHEIKGRVVDDQTGGPVARARVTVMVKQPGAADVPVWLLTDGSGAFALRNVPAGRHQLTIERPGYLLMMTEVAAIAAGSGELTRLFKLTPQVVIDGSVVDENGAPVRSFTVDLLFENVIAGRRQFEAVASPGSEEDEGSFRWFGLKAGRYAIRVTADSPQETAVYPPVFYPNALDVSGAERIGLTAGEERHIAIRLPNPLPSRKIEGRVVVQGSEVPQLQLLPADRALPVDPVGWCESDPAAGTFRFSGVPRGAYVLRAAIDAGNQRRFASAHITVGDRDVSGVLLEPQPPFNLKGKLLLEAGVELSSFLGVVLQSRDVEIGAGRDGEGNFQFINPPPGEYRLALNTESAVYLRHVWQGGRDVLHKGVTILENADSPPLEIVLGGPGATVQGVVEWPDSGLTSVTVAVLRPEDNELVLERSVDVSSGDGRFLLRGLPPGDFLLYAWPTESPAAYAEPDFLDRFGSLGKPITVTATERITVGVEHLIIR